MVNTPVGYAAICKNLALQTIPHYRESYIAQQGRGKTIIENYHEIHIYPKTYGLTNESDLLAQLEFALKYDGINLEIIKALFDKIEKKDVLAYIKKQPTGIYSRKIWYLYEWLMADLLDLKDSQRIKYIDLIDPKLYFTSDAIKSPRHAIKNNLLGNKVFCPIVRKTSAIEKYLASQLENKVTTLLNKYDPYLVKRACQYLYTKETMSSYQIEKEQPDKNRLSRFVNLLQQASSIEALTKEKLVELQNTIVDPRFKEVDYRYTQNYVGETVNPYIQRIHYIPPKPEDVSELMQGLLAALERMLVAQVHPVIIAAIIAFGFVFIHPFDDGNGRIHRFLIHYILAKTNFAPKNMIFPVSSVMLQNMSDYDSILESFSKSLLTVLTHYDLSDIGTMIVHQKSKAFYQYIDFTQITEYLFANIDEAINHYVEQEIKFLIHYDRTKLAIQGIVDIPDKDIDLLIKFVMQNNGKLSSQKRNRFFPLLTDDEINHLTHIINEMMDFTNNSARL